MDFRSRYKYNTDTDILGKGGFARVYKAYDSLLDRVVAIKVFNVSEGNKGSVLDEIKKAIKLSHPSLLSYYNVELLENVNAFGETEKMEIGVMEYANYGDLKAFMQTNTDKAVFIKLLKEVLSGLGYLHSKGVIHRDLKPQNILLIKDNDVITAKISDFGISKVIEKEAASDSALMGTIEYMAPEQFEPKRYGIDGRIAPNLDIWAFGIMLYELLTENKPFGQRGGDTTAEEIMQRILSTELPAELDEMPEPFRSVIKKCLVADAKVRTSDCNELIAILDNKSNSPAATPKPKATLIVGDETQVFDRNSLVRKNPEAQREKEITTSASKIPTPAPKPVPEEKIIQEEEPEEEPDNEKSSNAPLIIVILLLLALTGVSAYYFFTEYYNKVTYPSALEAYQKNPALGLTQMHQLAHEQNNSARKFLGDYFWDQQNTDSAFEYYSLLANSHEKGITARLGEIYFKGLGHVPEDASQARQFFESAANKDQDTLAYVRLGQIYYEGRGNITPSTEESYKWSKKAAEAGSLNGMVSMGTLSLMGIGTEKNFPDALKWYTKASDLNYGQAKFFLAGLYEKGLGVPADKKKAIELYKAALSLGWTKAEAELKRLEQ